MNDEVGFFSARVEPKGVSAGFEFVSPELAAELLRDFNTHNRRLRSRQVSLYAESMRQDRWSLNGEPIQFDADGTLLNGQHRLSAIVESGVGVWLLIVQGLPTDAQDTMDSGIKRKTGDIAEIRGLSNGDRLTSAARLALHLGDPSFPRMFSNDEVMQAVWDNPGLVEANEEEIPPVPMSPSPLLYCFWRITEASPEMGREFFQQLSELAELPMGSPILALNRRLVAYKTEAKAGDGWTRRQEVVAMVFRAFNAWAKGEMLTRLVIPRAASGRVLIPSLVKGR